MAFKFPHHLRIFNINIICAFVSYVVFTTKQRSSSINSETSNAVDLHWPLLRSLISLIVNNMVNTGRLINLNTLSNNLIVIISLVNHIFSVTSWPFFALTQSSIARRLNSQMVSLPSPHARTGRLSATEAESAIAIYRTNCAAHTPYCIRKPPYIRHYLVNLPRIYIFTFARVFATV